MNIDPVRYLVLPRMVAIALAVPALVIFSIPVGWLGGALVCDFNQQIAVGFASFFQNLREVVEVERRVQRPVQVVCLRPGHRHHLLSPGLDHPRRPARHRPQRHQGRRQFHRAHPHPGLLPDPLSCFTSKNERPPHHPDSVSVEVRDLRKSFGALEVLKGINFQVNPGEIFVIMGPSGSGKSVLLKHIIGLMTPDAGEILIDGEPIRYPACADKYRLAMVFQSGALLTSLTVGENVGLYLTEHRLKPPAEIAAIVARKRWKSSA